MRATSDLHDTNGVELRQVSRGESRVFDSLVDRSVEPRAIGAQPAVHGVGGLHELAKSIARAVQQLLDDDRYRTAAMAMREHVLADVRADRLSDELASQAEPHLDQSSRPDSNSDLTQALEEVQLAHQACMASCPEPPRDSRPWGS
jgi:hypothetical protein